MAKNTEYEFEETMVTLTDEDGIDKDFYVDEKHYRILCVPHQRFRK